jgi:hypothetical protein
VTSTGPDRRRDPGATTPRGPSVDNADTDEPSVSRQLRRRREASRRLARLAHGGADPLTDDHHVWQDSWDVEMARLGLAPEWQRQRAVEAWERGIR